MIEILKARFRLGRQTVAWPDGPARFPERFRGRPVLDPARCPPECAACLEACAVQAIAAPGQPQMALDLGRCVFCGACADACPEGALAFTRDFRLATTTREELLVTGGEAKLARALDARMRSLFGRSLRLRQVSAGGCNGCEAELNATSNIQFDLSRFGIQFVASPRHADGIVVTGPVTENMLTALRKTYEAVPAPKLVIAVGACAISGGPYVDHPEVHQGADSTVPVDLYVPGCPPHPYTILEGLLGLLGRLDRRPDPAG